MACSCKSSGRIPKQQRFVAGEYEVQPGDHVGSICGALGVSADRWPELVGANLDKPLGEAPYGYKQRCFAELKEGEKLRVPGCWNRTGAVSGPMFSGSAKPVFSPPASGSIQVDQLSTMITAMNQLGVTPAIMNMIYPVQLPPNVDMNDVVAVMYSWWPYAKFPGITPGIIPPLPTPANPTPVPFNVLVSMGKQAVEFLRATGIVDGKSPKVQDIPWDIIQWKDIPWNTLGTQALQELSQVMLGTPIPGYTTPAVNVPNQAPDFFDANFANTQWSDILKDVTFSDSLADVLADPEAVACIKKNPDRLKKLTTCENCYANTEEFKKILCASEPADPCECGALPQPPDPNQPDPNQPAPTKEDNTALIVAASVIGVLGVAATAFALSKKG